MRVCMCVCQGLSRTVLAVQLSQGEEQRKQEGEGPPLGAGCSGRAQGSLLSCLLFPVFLFFPFCLPFLPILDTAHSSGFLSFTLTDHTTELQRNQQILIKLLCLPCWIFKRKPRWTLSLLIPQSSPLSSLRKQRATGPDVLLQEQPWWIAFSRKCLNIQGCYFLQCSFRKANLWVFMKMNSSRGNAGGMQRSSLLQTAWPWS